MKKARNSNMELLRIFTMLMIVIYHIYVHCVRQQLGTGEIFITPTYHNQLFILSTISPMGIIGNTIFILISGYFMAHKETINLVSIAKKLLLQQGFSAIILTIISILVYRNTGGFSLKLFEITSFNDMSWYVGYYFLVILCASLFLNKFLAKLDKTNYIKFLVITFAITQFSWIIGIFNSLAGGLISLFVGLFLYALGGYIHRFNPFENIRTIVIIGIILASYLLIYISGYSTAKNDNCAGIPNFENYYFLPICMGICIFELFRRIPPFKNKVVNYIGASTFMVYLLHDNNFFYSIWDTQDWITLLYNQPVDYTLKHILWGMATFLIGTLSYSAYLLSEIIFRKCYHLILKTRK